MRTARTSRRVSGARYANPVGACRSRHSSCSLLHARGQPVASLEFTASTCAAYFARINLAISVRASSKCLASVSQTCQLRAIFFTTLSAATLPR